MYSKEQRTFGAENEQSIPGLADIKPKRVASLEARCEKNLNGESLYILHNPDANTYVEIDPQNYFLWELMDGEHTVADLAMAYFSKFGAFPFDRLSQLIAQLDANSLLEGASSVVESAQTTGFAFRLKRLADTAFQREYDWRGADEYFTAFYRRIGWVFFTRPALMVFGMITVVGLVCFVVKEQTKTFQLLSINGSYGAGLMVLFIANWVVLFWHESGHGLTCKSFGRRIRKAGMMFYFGMPVFFVDVSDMWMAARVPRILVSLAGPFVNVIIGGAIAIIVAVLPPTVWTQALFQASFIAYLGALLNLNPLLELDGYYVLMDWLDTPLLRQKSFAFVRKELLGKIRDRKKFTQGEICYSIYGVLAVVFSALMVLAALYVWERELKMMVHDLATGKDVLAVMLLGGLTLLAGASLALGLAARLILAADKARGRWLTSKGEE